MSPVDPIRPYLGLIRTVLCIGLLVGTYITGCTRGADGKAEELAGEISSKNARIGELERAVSGHAQALADAQSQSQAAIDEAERRRQLADAAAQAAELGAEAARKAAADFERKWADAAKRKPACAALLATDMEAVCGLSLR